MPEIII